MKKKEPIKVSLSTILLVLAIITIIVMGMYIYKLANDKTIEAKKSNELQNQVTSLNQDINNLKENTEKVLENDTNNKSISNNEALEMTNTLKETTKENKENYESLTPKINGVYKIEEKTDNYYHFSEVEITNQTDNSINFSINAAHGNNANNVNVGEVNGVAQKIDVPKNETVSGDIQVAYQFTEKIDGETCKITFVYTAHRQFEFLKIIEEYPNDVNPYGGNRVYFAGEYEKISK